MKSCSNKRMRSRIGVTGALIMLSGLFMQLAAQPVKHAGVVVPPSSFDHARSTLDEIFMSGDVPRPIPDGPRGVAESVLEIPSPETIRDLNVLVTITHTWIRDLRISLIAPDDTTEVLLLDLFPGDSAVNMTGCWFDDNAAMGIYEARPPFTGIFRPLEPLDVLNGRIASGRWRLRVEDRFPVDTGRIEVWGIELNPVVNLQGTVRDADTQAGISGVTVEVMEVSRRTTTSASGTYEFSGIPAGTYSLRFLPSNRDFRSTTSPVAIPDQDSSAMPIVVGFYDSLLVTDVIVLQGQLTTQNAILQPAGGVITDVNVTVNVTHSYVGDLALLLISPDDAVVALVRELESGEECAALGANLVNCTFDDEATRPFTAGTAPFTGNWQPYQRLSAFDNRAPRGEWRLLAIDQCPGDDGRIENATLTITVASAQSLSSPRASANEFSFDGSFPNPFNAQTEFRFSLVSSAQVELHLFNVLGQECARIVSAVFDAGPHQITFDANGLSSGLYFAQLAVNNVRQTRKVVLIR